MTARSWVPRSAWRFRVVRGVGAREVVGSGGGDMPRVWLLTGPIKSTSWDNMVRPVGTWDLRLRLGRGGTPEGVDDTRADLPAFLAIARAIAEDVRTGR